MRLPIDNSAANTTLAAPQPVSKLNDITGGIDCTEKTRGIFIAAGVGAENGTFTYQVIGWFELKSGRSGQVKNYLPIKIAEGTWTLGATTVGSSGLSFALAAALICDTVTETMNSVRASIMSPADDTTAWLEVDMSGLAAISIETKLGTSCTAASVAFQPDDVPLTVTDVELAPGDINIGNVDIVTMPAVAKTLAAVSQFVAVPSTAEALAASSTPATFLQLYAKKAAGNNTGNVFVGNSTLDQGVAEGPELVPGGSVDIRAVAGTAFDLNDIYIDADNAADGVVGYYIPA